jgi:hypothetical protein
MSRERFTDACQLTAADDSELTAFASVIVNIIYRLTKCFFDFWP